MPGNRSGHRGISSFAEEQAMHFQEGSEQALSFFFHEFFASLSLFGYRLVGDRAIAEDIASEAFVKTWKMHHKLDSYGGIRAYLYKTVRRDCLRTVKQERKRTELHQFSKNEIIPLTPFHELVSAETYRLVHAALQSLSPGNRRVISMHFLEGKSTGEIARELQLHPHTVQTQKARGLKALRKILGRPLTIVICLALEIFFTSL